MYGTRTTQRDPQREKGNNVGLDGRCVECNGRRVEPRNGHGCTAKATAFAAVTTDRLQRFACSCCQCTAAMLPVPSLLLLHACAWIMSAHGFALSFRKLGPRLTSAILELVILAGSALSP